MPTPPLVHLDDLCLTVQGAGTPFLAQTAPVAALLGARRLGARLVELAAGAKAWPYHCHHANDEMFIILAGTGTLRFDGAEFAVRAGDVVVCPAGGPETAHQLRAGAEGALRYLAVSTMNEPDVMQYPDSGKLAVFAGSPPGGNKKARRVDLVVRADSAVDYLDGEE